MRPLPTTRHVLDALLEGWSGMGRTRIVQVAVAGRWEEARGVEMPSEEAVLRRLVREACERDVDVAAEYEWLGHPLVFVGARRGHGEPDARATFEDRVVRVAALSPSDPGLALATLAGGPPADMSHIELGAANAWQSVGPMRLWPSGSDAVDGEISNRLGERPELARCVAPVALEVAFASPCECWIGVEVSQPSGGSHIVAPATVRALLHRLLASERSDR